LRATSMNAGMATTASQMLRDDQRLRNLHRETRRRRKRFLEKQKRLEDEEERRRTQALQQRRQKHTRNMTLRRHGNNRKREHRKVPTLRHSPVRAQRRDIAPMENKSAPRGSPSFIVPVCDQMASPSLSPPPRRKGNRLRTRRAPHKLKPVGDGQGVLRKEYPETFGIKQQGDDVKGEEEFDRFEAATAMSDQQSVAELDRFEDAHFGVDRSMMAQSVRAKRVDGGQYAANNKESECHEAGGYQALFEQKEDFNKSNGRPLESTTMSMTNGSGHRVKEPVRESAFNLNDVDMKTPEDNDSVKINPKDSIEIDGAKMSFSTVYDSNLMPLQSVFERPCPPPRPQIAASIHPLSPNPKPRRRQRKRFQSNIPEPTKRLKASIQSHVSMPPRTDSNYGIKLPRLTQSILKEKDRHDIRHGPLGLHPLSKYRQQNRHQSPLKSVLSAPAWNHRSKQKDIGQSVAGHRKRKTSTIIDDFFKNSQEFTADCSSIRQSNQTMATMFLPHIQRPQAKPSRRRNTKIAYSVMADQDILRTEAQLNQSLERLNERLSTLDANDGVSVANPRSDYRRRHRVPPRNAAYGAYLSDGKVASIPRKLKVKKSPTFKSSRQRRRWKS